MSEPTLVYLEVGTKRVFACAQAWPGWCRSARTEEAALAALAAYGERYAVVAGEAGIPFAYPQPNAMSVVERLAGSTAYTDFGVPGAVTAHDREPLAAEDAMRQAGLVAAAWVVFDRVAAAAPAELRKGPRGGGRDRDDLIDHVLAAEAAYARKLGIKLRQPARDDTPAIGALRAAILAALRAPAGVSPPGPSPWPPRYAARRIAWHVLDHAWEMEDRGVAAR
jgi:hypothetical protein